MTLQQAYIKGKELLCNASVLDADIDAWYLLEYITGVSRSSYYGNPFKKITEDEADRYFDAVNKRRMHIPLQHITGEQDFYGLIFKVNEHVLVPRQDTEVLVEEVLSVIKSKITSEKPKILDMCTGSGCILLSTLKYAEKKCTGLGADISKDALDVACYNKDNLKIDAEFVLSDVFENINGRWDVIVSNPPYIRSDVIPTLSEEVKDHDPLIALDGKEDGLYFYRKIVKESVDYISDGGYLMFEIGHDQGEDVKNLMENAGYSHVYVKKDLAGLDRIVAGVYYHMGDNPE